MVLPPQLQYKIGNSSPAQSTILRAPNVQPLAEGGRRCFHARGVCIVCLPELFLAAAAHPQSPLYEATAE
eukprot:3063404-Lingulodinium_polyedra.AAC.1